MKDYRKKPGHRQPYTLVKITGISAEGKAPEKAAAPAVKEESAKKPSLNMKKAELIEFAKENGIEVDEKATKAVILEAIEAAL